MQDNQKPPTPSLLDQIHALGEEMTNRPLRPPLNRATQELDELLEEACIDPHEDVREPPACLQIMDNGVPANVCTLGNFSLAIGKAKSRKSFFTALTFSVVTGYENEKFTGSLPPGRNMGIYFDTEQSKYHVQKVLQRICKLTNQPEPHNIKVYSLRKFPPVKRLSMIEHAIYSNDKVGFVVIDGIRDLVTSINDEEQATIIAAKLLQWTEERGIHIMAVLHQNKGDNNARGHLGAELTHKAETVLSIAKNSDDKNLSIVEAAYSRDRGFNPFAFTIDVEGLPQIAEGWVKQNTTDEEDAVPTTNENIYSTLTKCFSQTSDISYYQLLDEFKYYYKEQFGVTLGNNRIKELIIKSKDNKWITQAKERSPYNLGSFDN